MAKKKKSKRGLLGRYYAEGVGDSRADKVGQRNPLIHQ